MSIIVLGKTGQIASYLSNFKIVISLDRSQLDFLKDDILTKLQSILKYKPRVIINCVSYNNVNDASKETIQAKAINIDAEKMPFDDDSFDFIWSWGVIHHSNDTNKIVKEIGPHVSKREDLQ